VTRPSWPTRWSSWQARTTRSGAGWPGGDAIATVEQKAKDLLAQADAYRELSTNLAHEEGA
jgi:hypothetical protein